MRPTTFGPARWPVVSATVAAAALSLGPGAARAQFEQHVCSDAQTAGAVPVGFNCEVEFFYYDCPMEAGYDFIEIQNRCGDTLRIKWNGVWNCSDGNTAVVSEETTIAPWSSAGGRGSGMWYTACQGRDVHALLSSIRATFTRVSSDSTPTGQTDGDDTGGEGGGDGPVVGSPAWRDLFGGGDDDDTPGGEEGQPGGGAAGPTWYELTSGEADDEEGENGTGGDQGGGGEGGGSGGGGGGEGGGSGGGGGGEGGGGGGGGGEGGEGEGGEGGGEGGSGGGGGGGGAWGTGVGADGPEGGPGDGFATAADEYSARVGRDSLHSQGVAAVGQMYADVGLMMGMLSGYSVDESVAHYRGPSWYLKLNFGISLMLAPLLATEKDTRTGTERNVGSSAFGMGGQFDFTMFPYFSRHFSAGFAVSTIFGGVAMAQASEYGVAFDGGVLLRFGLPDVVPWLTVGVEGRGGMRYLGAAETIYRADNSMLTTDGTNLYSFGRIGFGPRFCVMSDENPGFHGCEMELEATFLADVLDYTDQGGYGFRAGLWMAQLFQLAFELFPAYPVPGMSRPDAPGAADWFFGFYGGYTWDTYGDTYGVELWGNEAAMAYQELSAQRTSPFMAPTPDGPYGDRYVAESWSDEAGTSYEDFSAQGTSPVAAPDGYYPAGPAILRVAEVFSPGDPVVVEYEAPGLAGAYDAWIGILPVDAPHGSEYEADAYDVSYEYVSDISGTVTLYAPGEGVWDVRLYSSDSGGYELASATFQVAYRYGPTEGEGSVPADTRTLEEREDDDLRRCDDSGDPTACSNASWWMTLRGDPIAGEDLAQRAIAAEPECTGTAALAHLNLGDAWMAQGRTAEALESYKLSLLCGVELGTVADIRSGILSDLLELEPIYPDLADSFETVRALLAP